MERFDLPVFARSHLRHLLASIRVLRWSVAVAGGFFLLGLLLCEPAANAQTSAAISGRVTDSSGAAVSGATITVKNRETGVTREAASDNAGWYRITSLGVGEHDLRINKPGFQQEIHEGIRLVVGQEATIDSVLRLGQINEQIKVNADAPVVSVS